MTFYDVFFNDGGKERITVAAMSTEQYRLANGGKSNADLALDQVREKFPNRYPVKIVRVTTGQVIWHKS
jgi:hypothetical protein